MEQPHVARRLRETGSRREVRQVGRQAVRLPSFWGWLGPLSAAAQQATVKTSVERISVGRLRGRARVAQKQCSVRLPDADQIVQVAYAGDMPEARQS